MYTRRVFLSEGRGDGSNVRWAPVVDPVVLPTEPQGSTTVTSDQIAYHQRVRVLAHPPSPRSNVAETRRVFGVSRQTFYK